MDKLKALLQKLGIELTADQAKQVEEVISKEFVSATDAAADKTKLEELTKQLADQHCELLMLHELGILHCLYDPQTDPEVCVYSNRVAVDHDSVRQLVCEVVHSITPPFIASV